MALRDPSQLVGNSCISKFNGASRFAVHPQSKFACFYTLTVHATVYGSGRLRRT